MLKSHVLFSLALGGLVLVGCSKEETPVPVTTPAAGPTSAPSTPTTGEATPASGPATEPTSTHAAADIVNPAVVGLEKKGSEPLAIIEKNVPTTNPITDANK
jgi:hypothetical protein